jgi:hypothetical protein
MYLHGWPAQLENATLDQPHGVSRGYRLETVAKAKTAEVVWKHHDALETRSKVALYS